MDRPSVQSRKGDVILCAGQPSQNHCCHKCSHDNHRASVLRKLTSRFLPLKGLGPTQMDGLSPTRALAPKPPSRRMGPAGPHRDAKGNTRGLLARREGSTYCEQSRAVDRTDLCYLGPRYACGTRRVASVPSASVQPPSRIRGWTPSALSCFWQAMSHHSSPPPRFPWMAAYPSAQRDFLSGGSLNDRAANAKFSCFTCSESSLRLCAMSSNSW